MKQSKHELLFNAHLKSVGCPAMVQQYRFYPDRKWAFDFAHCPTKTAIEIDGGEFMRVRGAHARGVQMARDYEKRNEAALLGWVVFQLTGQMVQKHGMMWAGKVKAMIEARKDSE